MQLNKLNEVFQIAKKQKNPSAMVTAIREQNEMLGYHRENAPKPEKELARRNCEKKEIEELERIARQRTNELSRGELYETNRIFVITCRGITGCGIRGFSCFSQVQRQVLILNP